MRDPAEPRPVFDHPGTAEQERHRLLLIAYHFPPDPAVGARRWEKLASYLTDHGWGLDVVTRAGLPTDPARMERLPAGVRVYETPVPELWWERLEHRVHGWYQALTRSGQAEDPAAAAAAVVPAQGEYSIPISQVPRVPRTTRDLLRMYWVWTHHSFYAGWAMRAARVGRAIADPDVHLAVISSGPPHMGHEAARRVSRATDIPFIVDMRDPWTLMEELQESFASPLWLWLARRYERRFVRDATLVITNTEPAQDAFRAAYPAYRDRFITIMNGADDDPLPVPRHGHRFLIAFAGSIYLSRDVRCLFRGAALAIQRLSLTPADFGLAFMGSSEADGGVPIALLAQEEGIAEYVDVLPRRPHAEALAFLAGGTMLPIFAGPSTISIGAKTFEYVRFSAWILAMTTPGSAIYRVLRDTGADIVHPDDREAIARVIVERYEQYRRGVVPPSLAQHHNFDRRYQARKLIDAIARCARQDDTERSALASRS